MTKNRELLVCGLLLALTACSPLGKLGKPPGQWDECEYERTIRIGENNVEVEAKMSSRHRTWKIVQCRYRVSSVWRRIYYLRRDGYMKGSFPYKVWSDSLRHMQEDLRLSELVSQTFAHFSKKKDIVRKLGLSELDIVIGADGCIAIDKLRTCAPLLKYYSPWTLRDIFNKIAAFRYVPPVVRGDTVGYVDHVIDLTDEANEWKKDFLQARGMGIQ